MGSAYRHHVIDPAPPRDPHVKAVGDIDGDGYADVVAASSDGGPLVWYRNPGWEKHLIAPAGQWSCTARVIDMDGDGDGDVLISEWYGENRLEWFENPRPHGDPAVDPWKHHTIGAPRAHDICTGDLDGDGQMEIVTRTQGDDGDKLVLWKRDAAGAWASRLLPCPAGEGLAIGPLAGSGRLDIVIGGRWYEAPAETLADAWAEHVYAEWPIDAAVQVGDIDGDGRAEIVVSRSEGLHRVSWFAPPADPRDRWAEHVVDDSVDFAHGIVLHDLTGDGSLDIVTAEMHQSPRRRVLVYLNRDRGRRWEREVVADTGSHNVGVLRLADTGNPAIVGANWSGPHQPLELWERVL